MANELRVRTGFLGGLIEDNPLSSGATTLTSAALASMPVIASTQHMAITLDPDGLAGAPEVAYVTAHSAGATTATIARGQEGTTARQHDRDMLWVHSVTVKDYDGAGGGSGLIGRTVYVPAGDLSYNVVSTSATLADVDSTNLTVTFTAPPSGKVQVALEFLRSTPAGNQIYFGLRDGAGLVANSHIQYSGHAPTTNDDLHRVRHTFPVDGLTPGTSYTWRMASKVSGGTGTIYYGNGAGTFGPIIMEVWAVNL